MNSVGIEAKIPKELIDMLKNLSEDISQIKSHISDDVQLKPLKDFQSEVKVSRDTIYRWIKNGEIETVKIGGHRFVKMNKLLSNKGVC